MHVQLHINFFYAVPFQIDNLGLNRSWSFIGGTTFQRRDYTDDDGGECDSSGGPRSAGPHAWPTLVIVSGVSQSLSSLRADKDWWFRASGHQVKTVLLAKYDRSRDEIRVEKREETVQDLAPILRQTILITRDTTTNLVSYNAAGGELDLSFRLLFLREAGAGEEDILLDIPALQDYADRVWFKVQ